MPMAGNQSSPWSHPLISRRPAVQAGAVGLLGLGTNHLRALQAATAAARNDARAAPANGGAGESKRWTTPQHQWQRWRLAARGEGAE